MKNNKLKEITNWKSSSFHGTRITTTPQSLIDLADKYNIPYGSQNYGNDKTNFDFDFQYGDDLQFTVYDWKEYQILDLDREYEFHIGGECGEYTDQGKELLNELLN